MEIRYSTVTLVMRCHMNAEISCVRLRSVIIRMVRETINEICPKLQTSECIIPSSKALQNTPLQVSLINEHSVPMSEVARAVSNGERYVRDSAAHRYTDIDTLLYFEPYAHLSQGLLVELLNKSHSHQIQQIPRSFVDRLSESYEQSGDQTSRKVVMALLLAVTILRVRPTDDLDHVLQVWKDATEGTYQCLRAILNEFSIFAGRNPLVTIHCFSVSISLLHVSNVVRLLKS